MSSHVSNVQSQQVHQTISNISLQFSACFFLVLRPQVAPQFSLEAPSHRETVAVLRCEAWLQAAGTSWDEHLRCLGTSWRATWQQKWGLEKVRDLFWYILIYFLNYLDLSWLILIDLGKWWWVITETWELGHCLTDLTQGALAEENQRQNPCLDQRLGGDLGFGSPQVLLQVSSAWCAPLKTYIWYHIVI